MTEQVFGQQTFTKACEPGEYSNDGLTCKTCDLGKYNTDQVYATSCTECAPGKHSISALECETCASGSYSNSGSSVCTECPGGYSQNIIGQSACKECQSGQSTANYASKQCTHCSSGKYQNENAQSRCLDCPKGWQQRMHGSISCTECRVGTYYLKNGGTPACLNCNIGKYQNEIAQQECKYCPLGFSSVKEQSSFCGKCPKNVESTEPLCYGWGLYNSTEYVPCPQGTYRYEISTTTCIDCPLGSISAKYKATEGYDICRTCTGGTGVNIDKTLCVDCPVGMYSSNGICSRCALGKFSNSVGASACLDCLVGTYSNATTNATNGICDSCPQGWSTNGVTGADKCVTCTGGFKSHVKQGSCTQNCPDKSILSTDDVSKCDTCGVGQQYDGSNCVNCPIGFYKDVSMPFCSLCPQWSVSSNSRGKCMLCAEGSIPKDNICQACHAGMYQQYQEETRTNICVQCPAGFMQSSPGTAICTSCDAGKYQLLLGQISCNFCDPGMFQAEASGTSCRGCPDGHISTQGSAACTMCTNGKGTSGNFCNDCVPGKGSLNGVCDDCPVGKHSIARLCEPCSAGKSQQTTGQTSCNDCDTGRFSAIGATSCSKCAARTHSPDNGACVNCMDGQYRGVDDPEDHCFTCPLGLKAVYSDLNTISCEECALGKKATGELCTDCDIGFFGEAGVCVSCPSGYYQDSTGQGACTKCGSFKYSTVGSIDSASCKLCGNEYTIVENGLCQVCPYGKIYGGASHLIGDCQRCLDGTEVASKTTCKQCGKNEFSVQGEYCQTCPTGFANKASGSSSCIKCVAGECNGVCPEGGYLSEGICKNCPLGYVSMGGYQNKCFECTKGTYQSVQSKSVCALCSPGYYSTVGANNDCQACPKGQYQNEEGQSGCQDCTPGKYNQFSGQPVCDTCLLGTFTADFKSINSVCKECPAGKKGVFGGKCADCPEGSWQDHSGKLDCNKCDGGGVPYSKAQSTKASDCFDINGIVSYVFGMKDDGKVSQTLDTDCEIRPNMVLLCPGCTCNDNVRDGFWAGPVCNECRRGYAGGRVGKCLIKCPGYDGVHDSTMCNGNGKCWYGKHGSGECLCGGKNILDSTSDNVVVSVKTCPAGQRCPGYGTDVAINEQYKPLYYLLEYRQYSVFVLQLSTHTPKRGHMWFERYSPQNIYENVCSSCVGKYDGTTSTEIGYFDSQNNYARFQNKLQLENGFHGENCQYECAACLNNGRCLNTPHSFYYNYGLETVESLSQQVFVPQTQCICSSSIYDGDAMCCPHGFEPYVYFGKRGVKPYFQYTSLPFITNIVNRQLPYWTDEDLWLKPGYAPSYFSNGTIPVSNINNMYGNSEQIVQKIYETVGPYTKHTFYGNERDICRACPGLFGKGVTSRSVVLNTASEAEDFWWDSAAEGKKCNGLGVCDFYSKPIESDVLFMGEYRTDNSTKFKLNRNYTSCRDNVNNNTKHTNKVELSECIRQAVDSKATAFVYSEPYKFIWDQSTMPKSGQKSKFPFAVRTNVMNRRGYISTIEEGERWYEIVSASTDHNYIPTPDPNGEHTFHPWKEKDCQMVTSECIMTVKLEYNLYKVGQTGQGDERLDGASFDRFDTCLTYDDGNFKTVIGNYVTKKYENGQDPFLGGHCPKGHFCTATGIGTSTVGYKEACPPGYFQPELTQSRTGSDIRCSQMDTSHANCTENSATKRTDYVDKICKRCQPNEYAPEGSSACTACPAGRVKKLSGNIDDEDKKYMYNIPITLSGTYWYYIEDETGFEMSDCALVPNGIIHVPEADKFMTAEDHRFLPVFPCPFAYSSPPGTYVIDGHDEVTRLLQKRTNVIRAPFANVYTELGDEFAKVMKEFAKDHCFVCPSSSITGHGSTTCTTCFQDRTAFSTKEIITSIVEHTTTKFNDRTIGVGTQLAGLPVTHKIRVGQVLPSHTWILGVIDRENSASDIIYLKMVKIVIAHTDEGVDTLVEKAASKLQITPTLATCQDPTTFSEVCFTQGSNEVVGSFSVTLVTRLITSYDHWNGGKQFGNVPVLDNTVVKDIVVGLEVITREQVSIAQILGYCNYNFPDYIGIIVNKQQVTDDFKQTCIESVSTSCITDGCSHTNIRLKKDGNWTTEYPLCLGCESGKSNNVEIVGQCVDCERGFFTSTMEEASGTDCKPCRPGYYADKTGSKQCTACPRGYSQPNDGHINCIGCVKGHYQDKDGQPSCETCAIGQYMTEDRSVVACKQCTKGTVFDGTTSVCRTCNRENGYMDEINNVDGSCKTCLSGFEWVSPTEPCSQCLTGKKGQGGEYECIKCGNGHYTSQRGQTDCKQCPTGWHQVASGAISCTKCEVGKFQDSMGNQDCKASNPGYEATSEGLSKETPCDPNYYNGNSKGVCSMCLSGHDTRGKAAQTDCHACDPGQYTRGYSVPCRDCDTGQYQVNNAASDCTVCPGPKLTTWSEGSIACNDECASGEIVNHDSDGHGPEGVDDGACYACRYEGGREGEHTCYCAYHNNCFVKAVSAAICLFGVCL